MGQIPNSKNISSITNKESNKSSEIKKPKNLYRILIMFNDILWNNIEEMPLE